MKYLLIVFITFLVGCDVNQPDAVLETEQKFEIFRNPTRTLVDIVPGLKKYEWHGIGVKSTYKREAQFKLVCILYREGINEGPVYHFLSNKYYYIGSLPKNGQGFFVLRGFDTPDDYFQSPYAYDGREETVKCDAQLHE